MLKILFPTDFSEASENAFPYTAAFAKFLNRPIELVHYYHPVMNDLSGVDYNLASELLQVKKEQMENFVKKLGDTGVEITHHTEVGFPIQSIVEKSKEDDISLVIMSTKGEKNAIDKWLGSISSEVSVKAHCPVILVPENTKKFTIQNVLYATSKESLNEKSITKLQNLVQQLGAAVHFLYVSDDTKDSEELKNEALDILFANNTPNFSFSIHLIDGDNPVTSINEYVKDNPIDLTIMYNVSRSFWNSLLHRSLSKEMANHTAVPLLIMHQKDKD